MLCCPNLIKRYTARQILMIATVSVLGGLLLSISLAQTYLMFQVIFGISLGMAQGMLYFLPISVCWEYYPNRKGLLTGILIGVYGLSPLFFNMLSFYMINPENEDPDSSGFFSQDIAERVPYFLRYLFFIWMGLLLGSILLIK